MKFTTLISAALLAAAPALGCLETAGIINPVSGTQLQFAIAIDNGAVVCDSNLGWRIDQDNNFSVHCNPGYVYAFTPSGQQAWYSNGINSWSFTQQVTFSGNVNVWSEERFGCGGAVSAASTPIPLD
jgi:hypothetical protein